MSLTIVSRQTTSRLTSSRGLDLRIHCPQCRITVGRIGEDDSPSAPLLTCPNCFFQLRSDEGIWKALLPARTDHFERFMREYQAVRAAEGRGSDDPEYYLALPYRDLSGRNQGQWAIRSRTFQYLERNLLPPLEAAYPNGMTILDLGSGNGWLSYRLALRGHRPVAVDLLTCEKDGLAAAVHYEKRLPRLFPRFQAELDRLPFADSEFDAAIFNASFHYSENYVETMGEAIRCLRPGGTLIIADTAWYRREASGRQMVAERQEAFTVRHGFPSDGIASQEYLTDRRLADLEAHFGVRWQVHSPFYGIQWAMRPLLAKLKGKREPSRFRIYVAEAKK
jgi:SAM-dependent methyltransferase